jgi:hypothetical protein
MANCVGGDSRAVVKVKFSTAAEPVKVIALMQSRWIKKDDQCEKK